MSAEVLREAAALMRSDHGTEHQRHEMWDAMANLFENEASAWDAANREEFPTLHYNAARAGLLLNIARAYLKARTA